MRYLFFIPFLMLSAVVIPLSANQKGFQQQIDAVLSAPKEQRVVLMNNLKQKIAKMNFIARSKAIMVLKNRMGSQMQQEQMIEARKQQHAQELEAQMYANLSEYQSFFQRLRQQVQNDLSIPTIPSNPF